MSDLRVHTAGAGHRAALWLHHITLADGSEQEVDGNGERQMYGCGLLCAMHASFHAESSRRKLGHAPWLCHFGIESYDQGSVCSKGLICCILHLAGQPMGTWDPAHVSGALRLCSGSCLLSCSPVCDYHRPQASHHAPLLLSILSRPRASQCAVPSAWLRKVQGVHHDKPLP